MNALFTNLINDEAGFIISAELVIVATVAVLAMLVGLSEVSSNINNELEDIGSAFGSLNQSYTRARFLRSSRQRWWKLLHRYERLLRQHRATSAVATATTKHGECN